jgi:hypothetical protein
VEVEVEALIVILLIGLGAVVWLKYVDSEARK